MHFFAVTARLGIACESIRYFLGQVKPTEKSRLWNRGEEKFPWRQLLVTHHNAPCIFEEVTRECVDLAQTRGKLWQKMRWGKNGKFSGLKDSSRGSLATCCWIKERRFRESSDWSRKVCSISSFVYSVIFCGATKLEPKKTDALAGYSLFTAALFLAWKPQKYFYPQNDAFTDCGTDWWNRHQENSYWRKDLGETFFICLPTESMIYHTLLFWHYSKR